MSENQPSIKSQEYASHSLSTLGDVVKAILMPSIMAVAGAFAGIVTYVLTPVGVYVNSIFFPEKPQISFELHNTNPKKGDVIPVSVRIQPLTVTPISAGTLTIKYTDEIRPIDKIIPIIKTSEIKNSTLVTEKAIEFIANKTGQATITATLNTNKDTSKNIDYSKLINIDIAPAKLEKIPNHRDFSGTWIIQIGGINGTMELKDVNHILTGSYSLSNGTVGMIDGSRDTNTFTAVFFIGKTPSRYSINEAKFDPNTSKALEITGIADLMVPTKNKLDPHPFESRKILKFHADAEVPS